MPYILENISLKSFNTFGVDVKARWFTCIDTEEALASLFFNKLCRDKALLILGGGSNVLFTADFPGLVLKINIGDISHKVNGNYVYVEAGAGVHWNELVMYAVNRGFGGLENLVSIPGTVGASPIQNIGAYGVEVSDTFYACRAYELATHTFKNFSKEDCAFAYRDSIFKKTLKGQYIITNVIYRLSLKPKLNLEYGSIKEELKKTKIKHPTIKDVATVVAKIRRDKLPNPAIVGNAGSFFKNPIVSVEKFRHLQSAFPDIVHFNVSPKYEKISAAWLIEKSGWKGKTVGGAGIWKNQPLVIINLGSAKGIDIYNLSCAIMTDVKHRFSISLEPEVTII